MTKPITCNPKNDKSLLRFVKAIARKILAGDDGAWGEIWCKRHRGKVRLKAVVTR